MATLAANATPEAKKARNDEACSTAETFVNLYYERVDSKRHLIGMFDSPCSRLMVHFLAYNVYNPFSFTTKEVKDKYLLLSQRQ